MLIAPHLAPSLPFSDCSGDWEQQEEEVLALQAIYAEAFTPSANGRAEVLPYAPFKPKDASCEPVHSCSIRHRSWSVAQVCIPARDAANKITVSIHMPEDYPSRAAPVLELSGGCMGPQDQAKAIQHLHDIFQPGEVSLAACAATACLAQTVACLQSVQSRNSGGSGADDHPSASKGITQNQA